MDTRPENLELLQVKASMRAANWTHVQQAAKYDEWSGHEQGLTASCTCQMTKQPQAFMCKSRPLCGKAQNNIKAHNLVPSCFNSAGALRNF